MRTLIVFSILNHAAFAGSRVAVSLAGLELAASPFAIGLALSFYSLLPMFLSVPGGRWVDRAGLRQPLVGGTALLAFGVAVPLLAWDIAALFLASVTIGLGFMAFHLAMQKVAGDLVGAGRSADPMRRANFALLALGFSISGFAGPTSAGFLIDHVGHRTTFGLLAVAPLATLLWLWRFARAHPRALAARHAAGSRAGAGGTPGRAAGASGASSASSTSGSSGSSAASAASAAPGSESRVLDLMRAPELRRLYVAVALLSSAWDVHQFLVPLYGAKLGMSASSIGIVLGSFSVATFVVRVALPALSRRLSEWPLILFALAVSAAVYAVYPLFPGLVPMLVLSFALGLGLGVAQPMVLSLLHRESPAGRVGEAVGLRLTLINATQTFLPTAFGALGGALGLAPMFWGMAATVAGGLAYVRRRPEA